MNQKDKTDILVKAVLLKGDINFWTILPLCVEKAIHTTYGDINRIESPTQLRIIRNRTLKILKNVLKTFPKRQLYSYLIVAGKKRHLRDYTKTNLINILLKLGQEQMEFLIRTLPMKKDLRWH